jgi:hypothetical protein
MQLAGVYIKAQNLVYNGSFEITYSCSPTIPSTGTNINDAIGWQAAAITPDLFNACSNGNNNVPYNGFGYQEDCCGGNVYVGEYVFYKNSFGNDQREYIYTQLTDTLIMGHKYLAKMYVVNSNYWHNAITTMGMLFTDTSIILPSGQGYISANPQVKNTTLLTDTLNWMIVQDTFIAVGNETYLTIGNFDPDSTCGIVSSTSEAYYYIDNISVIDIATIGIEQVKEKVKIDVYPNPAIDKLYIETKEEDVKEIKLYDVLGKEQLSTTKKEIDISSLSNGVYFITVRANESFFSKKIIVQH